MYYPPPPPSLPPSLYLWWGSLLSDNGRTAISGRRCPYPFVWMSASAGGTDLLLPRLTSQSDGRISIRLPARSVPGSYKTTCLMKFKTVRLSPKKWCRSTNRIVTSVFRNLSGFQTTSLFSENNPLIIFRPIRGPISRAINSWLFT